MQSTNSTKFIGAESVCLPSDKNFDICDTLRQTPSEFIKLMDFASIEMNITPAANAKTKTFNMGQPLT
jgi:hypothetical protein